MPTYLLDANGLCKRYFFNAESTIQRTQLMSVIKKRPGPIDALVVACANDFDLADLILVSADVDLNALARQVNPENPFSRL